MVLNLHKFNLKLVFQSLSALQNLGKAIKTNTIKRKKPGWNFLSASLRRHSVFAVKLQTFQEVKLIEQS